MSDVKRIEPLQIPVADCCRVAIVKDGVVVAGPWKPTPGEDVVLREGEQVVWYR